MLNQKSLTIIIVILLALGLAYWITIRSLGGWVAIQLQPNFPFNPSLAEQTPNYQDPKSWAALPNHPSNANQRPAGENPANPARKNPVDVFFIHPTSFLSDKGWNDSITREDPILNYGILRFQAGAFNQCCQVYAPRYRQATLWSFIGEEPDTYQALEFAYDDIRRAFQQFLKWSGQRPFILAGHSQGSLHGMRLLQEVIGPNPNIRQRLVTAYLIGYAIPTNMPTTSIQPCQNPTDTQCFINWNSVVNEYDGDFWHHSGRIWLNGKWQTMQGNQLTCVNPLSWRLDGSLVSAALHPGGIWTKDMEEKRLPTLMPQMVSARCGKHGLLFISEPEQEFSSEMINDGDYHVYDYHLFYQSIRQNVAERIRAFRRGQRK